MAGANSPRSVTATLHSLPFGAWELSTQADGLHKLRGRQALRDRVAVAYPRQGVWLIQDRVSVAYPRQGGCGLSKDLSVASSRGQMKLAQ